jgi:Tfp pilus assembly protein PilF
MNGIHGGFMRNFLLAGLALAFTGSPLSAQSADSDSPEGIRQAMLAAEAGFFRSNDHLAARTEVEALLPAIDDLDTRVEAELLLAEAKLLTGYFELSYGEENLARRDLEQALDIAENLAESNVTSSHKSRAYRIAGDAYLYLASIRGTLFQMTNGSKMKNYPILALEADPNNARAILSRGIFLASVPRFAGGNPAEAAQLLRGASETAEGPLRFRMLVWLGIAEDSLGNASAARRALTSALALMPENSWAGDTLESLR